MPYWGLTRAILFGLWIVLTIILWLRGMEFFVAMLLGAVPSLLIDAVLAVVYGTWGIGKAVQSALRLLRSKS